MAPPSPYNDTVIKYADHYRFKTPCTTVVHVEKRVLVLKPFCRCEYAHGNRSRCIHQAYKVTDKLQSSLYACDIERGGKIISPEKCSYEILRSVEDYLKNPSCGSGWKFRGIFDRDGNDATFQKEKDLTFALLVDKHYCWRSTECEHRKLKDALLTKPQQEQEQDREELPKYSE